MAISIHDTYLGFTDKMTAMKKAKTEKMLNEYIRVEGKVMTQKEFIYLRITEKSAIPEIEENYQTWKKNSAELTKPKTVYRLSWMEVVGEWVGHKLSNEINKTLYDFACYVLENGFQNECITEQFISSEQETAKAAHEAEERKVAEEQAKKEAEAQAMENYKVWLTTAAEAYTNEETLEIAKEIFLDIVGEVREHLIKELIITIENIDNPLCRQSLKSRMHTGNPASKKVFFHVTGIKLPSTDKETMPVLDHLTAADYTGSIPYKKRKEYTRIGEEIKLESFYKLSSTTKNSPTMHKPHFIEAKGEHINKYGLDLFLIVTTEGVTATEGKSGLILVRGKNKTELFDNLKRIIETKRIETIKEHIQKCVERFGISPLYDHSENKISLSV